MVKYTTDLRFDNHTKEVRFFNEEQTTKCDRKTTKNQDGGEWEGDNGTRRHVPRNNLQVEIVFQETSTRSGWA